MTQIELTRPPVERHVERDTERSEWVGASPGAASPRVGRRWYHQVRYILPLGIVLCALLGTIAGGIRDDLSNEPVEAPPTVEAVGLTVAV